MKNLNDPHVYKTKIIRVICIKNTNVIMYINYKKILRVIFIFVNVRVIYVIDLSDASNDAVKPALNFVIQNCQTLCSM